jgi:rhamnogalacturonyl hydrolase YesR
MSVSINNNLQKLQEWVETRDYRGYEPFDGLSAWVRPLTFGNLFCERLLQQLVRQSPINLRPLLGIKPQDSTKGRGYMAWGYLIRYKTTGEQQYLKKAEACLDWLDHHRVPTFKHHSWSNAFDFSSRTGGYTRHDPIIVWTALIGQAYLEAFELTGEPRWLKIADSVCRWIMDVPRERTSSGNCLSYFANRQCSIHNANMLGAAMLARTNRHLPNPEYLAVARSAMLYSCSRQRPDGAWWYAEDENQRWIDNFHTGYNLSTLKIYLENTDDETFRSNFRDGLKYFKENFFEPNGCPKYYDNRTYPIDIQCAAQAIETLAFVSSDDPSCLDLAHKVAQWTIKSMQAADGHFYYRRYPLMTARTPMLHWGQATMFKALAELVHVTECHSSDVSAAIGRGPSRTDNVAQKPAMTAGLSHQ